MEKEHNRGSYQENDINRQLGFYRLCYRKMAIYSSQKTIYFVGGSNSFSNPKLELLVANRLENDLEMRSEEIIVPVGSHSRKDEILNVLRTKYSDPSISFTRKSFGLIGFIKFTMSYYAILVDEVEIVGSLAGHEIFEVKKCKLIQLFQCE